jgi:hypothetical protein
VYSCAKDSSTSPAKTSIANTKAPTVLFALKEWEHWASVLGSDSPAFVLYDDRSVIYYQKEEGIYKYVVLSEDEFTELCKSLLNPQIAVLKKNYSTTDITCENIYCFFFRFSNKKYLISVYGHPTEIQKGGTPPPKEIREIFSKVSNFKHKNAANWLPAKIEILFWPYDYAPDKSVEWPKAWPDLKAPDTIKRKDSLYSVYLDSKYFNELKVFVKKINPKGAVLVNGRKMTISYRLPIPGEDVFRKKP